MVAAPLARLMALSRCVKVCSVCVCVCVHEKWRDCSSQLIEFMCPDLLDPVNGRVTFSSDNEALFVLDTMATYSCDEGFGLNGAATRTCEANADITNPEGVWTGTAPTCECECSDC